MEVHIHDVIAIRILKFQGKIQILKGHRIGKRSPCFRASVTNYHPVCISNSIVTIYIKVFNVTGQNCKTIPIAYEFCCFISLRAAA